MTLNGATEMFAWKWRAMKAVVDSSESSITSRAEAIANLGKLGDHQIEQLLVYVRSKPLEDEDKQKILLPCMAYVAMSSPVGIAITT